jgi:manganese/zinc/iron transport system permease protein
MSPELEILAIAIVTAVAAALPGALLVLRRMALVSDAISHSILPGIAIAFFLTHDLSSPLLVVAAAATGVVTVALIEAINRSRLVPEDAAIGLVFPALFALGVILISRYAGDVHLDTDAVLLGELAFAPFDRLTVGGVDLGPVSLWSMVGILLLNLVFVVVWFKELKLATVDAGLAAVLGFSPALIHYGLMSMVSVTAVGAFSAVGSILVVALMIAPPATAYLLVERFGPMLWTSAAVAAAGAVVGSVFAFAFDVSIAGSMAAASGVLFAAALLAAPRRGIVAQMRRRTAQRLDAPPPSRAHPGRPTGMPPGDASSPPAVDRGAHPPCGPPCRIEGTGGHGWRACGPHRRRTGPRPGCRRRRGRRSSGATCRRFGQIPVQ